MRKRARHVWSQVRQGPTEAGYAFFRARRRRRNLADAEPELSASDRLVVKGDLDLVPADVTATQEVVRAWKAGEASEVRSVQWFLPWFHLTTGGGIHTVLRFAERFATAHGVDNRFCVYDRDDPDAAREVADRIGAAFPGLPDAPVVPSGASLGDADAAIATAWPSVFPLVRFRGARAKFFFLQDWEPDFYPAGAASAVLGQAASLGLPGIVNTPGLADSWRAAGNPATAFVPAVDAERYHPPESPRGDGEPVRIFFYGRPRTPRNAFGLGLAALRALKERFGDRVEIVSAGEDWSPGQYGAADMLDNRGMLGDLDAVAQLYRSCDVGLAFMLTRHPSYLPLELMASGAAVVSNRNPHTAWLLEHERNALLADPLPGAAARQLGRLVEDRGLRERLAHAGRETVAAHAWDEEIDRVFASLTDPASFE